MFSRICLLSVLTTVYMFNNFTTGVVLKGVTIRKWPYANRLANGQFEGFCVDLLNEIAGITRMAYTLQLSEHNKIGDLHRNGTVDGLIGQVYRNETDFAIADITVAKGRQRFVDFSHPFMRWPLSAIVRKELIRNISSFEDLAAQTAIDYGVKKYGSHLPLIHPSDTISKMYTYWDNSPNSYVFGTDEDGLKRVRTTDYGFISDGPFIEYTANRDCDLTIIEDKAKHMEFEYAIAMRKDLLFKNVITNAIKHLESVGKLQKLKDKYWRTDRCSHTESESDVEIVSKPFGKNRNEFYLSEMKTQVKTSRLRNWRNGSDTRSLSFVLFIISFCFSTHLLHAI